MSLNDTPFTLTTCCRKKRRLIYSNTFSGSIYKIDHESDSLKVFFTCKKVLNALMALHRQQWKGCVYSHVMASASVSALTKEYKGGSSPVPGSFIGGIDGLYCYRDNRLIGIQNGVIQKRIISILLDKAP